MMMRFRSCVFVVALAVFAMLVIQSAALAQTVLSAKAQEEADTRAELPRIIKEDPAYAAEAQTALDALNQPESTASGRQARNRREHGSRRIVNGLPSRSHPAVGALVVAIIPQLSASATRTQGLRPIRAEADIELAPSASTEVLLGRRPKPYFPGATAFGEKRTLTH